VLRLQADFVAIRQLADYSSKGEEKKCCIQITFDQISTAKLKPLRALHRPPINVVIFYGSLPGLRQERFLILGSVSHLRCFQRLSNRNIATQRCSWQKQLAHQRFPPPGPLVLWRNPLKNRTYALDRVRHCCYLKRQKISCFLLLPISLWGSDHIFPV